MRQLPVTYEGTSTRTIEASVLRRRSRWYKQWRRAPQVHPFHVDLTPTVPKKKGSHEIVALQEESRDNQGQPPVISVGLANGSHTQRLQRA